MSNVSENSKRIAKNTLLLYFRMLFMMLVALYTSRVVLNTLGVEDFGIYNVVGGVVTMFSFINGAMATGTQRYLNFELGRGDFLRLSQVFSTSCQIHILIAVLVIILAETVGLWFLYHKMTIPEARMDAALWVYQCSILSTAVMVISVPYNACIIAHERMSAFAYISVLEVILKLLIVYLLMIGNFDKLKLYAVLILIVQVGIRLFYGRYCSRHFSETKFRRRWDEQLFREMLGFAGWNLWGNCAGIAYTQGLNILLNMFFGPTVNAARGVAVQVQSAVTQFSSNFQTALNPQITKSYASRNLAYMHSLVFRSARYTFFLLLFFVLPIAMETETILQIWLKTVPTHTATFIRLMLCVTVIDAVANPFMVSAQATGKVRFYQSVVGGILLTILPISYVALRLGGDPESVFVVHLCVCISAFVVRMLIIRPMVGLRISSYLRQVVQPCVQVCLLACIVPALIKFTLPSSWVTALANCVVSCVMVVLFSYALGLTSHEREAIRRKAVEFIHKIRK